MKWQFDYTVTINVEADSQDAAQDLVDELINELINATDADVFEFAEEADTILSDEE